MIDCLARLPGTSIKFTLSKLLFRLMSTHPPEAQIKSVQDQLLDIERYVEDIEMGPFQLRLLERASLQRKLNALQLPIYRLPAETMGTIFLHALPPPLPFEFDTPRNSRRFFFPPNLKDIFFPMVLSAVSAYWRDVASSTPSLWTWFQFPAFLWDCKHPPLHVIDVYLRNSKNLPMRVDLAFPLAVQTETKNHFFHRDFDRLLINNLSRIMNLTLKNPPERWLHQLEKLTSAVDISIQWDRSMSDGNTGSLHFNRCLSLSRLALYHGAASEESLHYSRVLYQVPCSLTVLELTAIHIDVCIKVALRCPELVELCVRYSLQAATDFESELAALWFGERVLFSRLEVLFFGPVVGSWESAFLGKLYTPALRSFTVSNQSNDLTISTAEDGFGQFVRRLPSTFTTLAIEDCEMIGVDSCACLFNHQSTVEELVFVDSNMDGVLTLLEALQPSSGETMCMPRLKSLSLSGCHREVLDPRAYQYMAEWELDDLVTACERRLVKGNTFRIELSGVGIDWTPVLQVRLRALVRQGVRLQIVEDGDEVDWL